MADPQQPDIYPFLVPKNNTAAIPVLAWSKLVLDHDTLPFSQSCMVWKVYHCKCTTGKDHEFIVVMLRNNDIITSFFTDRAGDGDSPTRSSSSLVSVPATPNGSLHDLGASSIRLPAAKDSVFATQDGSEASILARATQVHGPHEILSTLEPSANHNTMNAAHVAILIRTVSQLRPQYDANRHQCYWFAHSIFQAIKSVTECEEKLGVNFNRRGKCYMLQVRKPGKSKDTRQERVVQSESKGQGTAEARSDSWKDLASFTPGQEPDVEKVFDAYDVAVKAAEETWKERAAEAERARKNELDAKQVDEERKKADEERKKADEERKKAAVAKLNEEAAKQTAAAAKQTAAAAEQNAADEKKMRIATEIENERLKVQLAEMMNKLGKETPDSLT